MRKDFGEWLRQQIKELGVTQKEFAEMIGIEQPHLSRILSGTRGASDETLQNIAYILKIPQEIVFYKAGKLTPSNNDNPRIKEITHLLGMLGDDDIEEIFKIAKLKVERKEKSKTIGKSREKPPARTLLNRM